MMNLGSVPSPHVSTAQGVRLVAEPSRLDFLHATEVEVGGAPSALEAYCAMTSDIPAWLSGAFRIRDLISRYFNVDTIQGFTPRDAQHLPALGERLDFFTVEDITPRQLVLTSRDTHLAVMVCLDLTPVLASETAPRLWRLRVTTSVEQFNTFGRLYMVPVAPTHGLIVKRMLRNVVATYPPLR